MKVILLKLTALALVTMASCANAHEDQSSMRGSVSDEDADSIGEGGKDGKDGWAWVKIGNFVMQRTQFSHYYNKNSNQSCRDAQGGKGTSPHDFDLQNHVSLDTCKRTCDNLGDNCFGYQFSGAYPHQGETRCEVWRAPIPVTEIRPAHYETACYIRPYYNKNSNQACRDAQGGTGTSPHDFEYRNYASLDTCKHACDVLEDRCFGYEFAPLRSAGRKCKVWRVPIPNTEVGSGVDCYVRTVGPNNAPEGEFETPRYGDIRSPCPFINTLANHGFINRNGQDIDVRDLANALQEIYRVDSTFLMDNPIAGAITLELTEKRDGKDFLTIDRLFQNRDSTPDSFEAQEHDSSFFREDSGSGNDRLVSPRLVSKFFKANNAAILDRMKVMEYQRMRIKESCERHEDDVPSTTRVYTMTQRGGMALQGALLWVLGQAKDIHSIIESDTHDLGSIIESESLPDDYDPGDAVLFTFDDGCELDALRNAFRANVDSAISEFCPDPSGGTPSLDPSITAIAGTYKTQARFGGDNGSFGNGGTWKMTISELGEIAFNDMPVEYEFDRATQFLSWNRQSDMGGATTNAEITFHSTLSAGYHFPNNEEDIFTGRFIINNGGGWLDFRGTLCTLDDWRDCRAPSRQPSE